MKEVISTFLNRLQMFLTYAIQQLDAEDPSIANLTPNLCDLLDGRLFHLIVFHSSKFFCSFEVFVLFDVNKV
jgi:hypothetical protein